MLGRKNLVFLKKEFPRIRQEGKIYDAASFGLMIAFGSGGGARASFVVSKKVDKRSVGRHEIKRKLSDAVSPFLPRLGKNVELVFLAKQKTAGASREDLQKEVELVLTRAHII